MSPHIRTLTSLPLYCPVYRIKHRHNLQTRPLLLFLSHTCIYHGLPYQVGAVEILAQSFKWYLSGSAVDFAVHSLAPFQILGYSSHTGVKLPSWRKLSLHNSTGRSTLPFCLGLSYLAYLRYKTHVCSKVFEPLLFHMGFPALAAICTVFILSS